jgi:hypothetical protein
LATASLPRLPEERYRHLVADNLKRTTRSSMARWNGYPTRFSAADSRPGRRLPGFLGLTGQCQRLRLACDEQIAFTESFVAPPALLNFGARLGRALGIPPEPEDTGSAVGTAASEVAGAAVVRPQIVTLDLPQLRAAPASNPPLSSSDAGLVAEQTRPVVDGVPWRDRRWPPT